MWIAGVVVAGGGYYLYDQTGLSRLGQLALGAGVLLPLSVETIVAILPLAGEEWKNESGPIVVRQQLVGRVPVGVVAIENAWVETTDVAGIIAIDLGPFADNVSFGESMEISVRMEADSAKMGHTVAPEIVNAWRSPPELRFALDSISVLEEAGRIDVPVRLSKPWHEEIIFIVSVQQGSKSIQADYIDEEEQAWMIVGGSEPIIIAAGQTSALAAIRFTDDKLNELDETGLFRLPQPPNAILGPDSLMSYQILDDDDPPVIQFPAVILRSAEDSPARVPVYLSMASGKDISFAYRITGGTATGQGVDYISESSTISIPAGDTIGYIEISVLDDAELEGDETILLALTDPVNATLGERQSTTHIIEDIPPPVIQFPAAILRAGEDSPVRLPLHLSAASGREISVSYRITGGTATGQGVDYIADLSLVSIPPGDTVGVIEFPVLDDAEIEGEETILLMLIDPVNATLGERQSITYIIEDNDVATPAPLAAASSDPPPIAAAGATIAILDFDAIGISVSEAKVLSNRLGTHLVAIGKWRLIERGQVQQILVEQDFNLSGCVSDECAVEVGQLLGCELMLAGSFGLFRGIYTIDMRIIDVETGGILRSTSYDVRGDAQLMLTEGLEGAARKLAGME